LARIGLPLLSTYQWIRMRTFYPTCSNNPTVSLHNSPSRWRQNVPPKRRIPVTSLRSVTAQKATVWKYFPSEHLSPDRSNRVYCAVERSQLCCEHVLVAHQSSNFRNCVMYLGHLMFISHSAKYAELCTTNTNLQAPLKPRPQLFFFRNKKRDVITPPL
jgi:hypothetical protein